MPRYRFEVEGDTEHEVRTLPSDDSAWSEVVTWCGEMLKDVDGQMPGDTDLCLGVFDGERRVAQIRLVASRCES